MTVTRHQGDNKSKTTSFLFPVNMTAKLERILHVSNALRNKDKTQSPHKQWEQHIKQWFNNNRATANCKFPSICAVPTSIWALLAFSQYSQSTLKQCNSKASFVGGPTFFSPWRKDWIVSNQYIHFLFQGSCHTGKTNNIFYIMTVAVSELPGGTASNVFLFCWCQRMMSLYHELSGHENQVCSPVYQYLVLYQHLVSIKYCTLNIPFCCFNVSDIIHTSYFVQPRW